MDLSFLRGSAIIVPIEEQHNLNKKADIIRMLHPYYSREFQSCANNSEKRLHALFDIKDRWTYFELQGYLQPFLGQSLDAFLMKNTRVMR
jgi:hypothetical protein